MTLDCVINFLFLDSTQSEIDVGKESLLPCEAELGNTSVERRIKWKFRKTDLFLM